MERTQHTRDRAAANARYREMLETEYCYIQHPEDNGRFIARNCWGQWQWQEETCGAHLFLRRANAVEQLIEMRRCGINGRIVLLSTLKATGAAK